MNESHLQEQPDLLKLRLAQTVFFIRQLPIMGSDAASQT